LRSLDLIGRWCRSGRLIGAAFLPQTRKELHPWLTTFDVAHQVGVRGSEVNTPGKGI